VGDISQVTNQAQQKDYNGPSCGKWDFQDAKDEKKGGALIAPPE
jgi:hypothetical protein